MPVTTSPSDSGAAPPRVVVEQVTPSVDGGRYPVKCLVGEELTVGADVFADGHESVAAAVAVRPAGGDWRQLPMRHAGNDRWLATIRPDRTGLWELDIVAWIDAWTTWRHDAEVKADAGVLEPVDLAIGAQLLADAADRAGPAAADAEHLATLADRLRGTDPASALPAVLGDERVDHLMWHHARTGTATRLDRVRHLDVDRERAECSAWYELFPRSWGPPDRHGTFRDVAEHLPYVAGLGFDVLYLPPIHPIGRTHRKGRNNATAATPTDVGSPWAIGAAEGGHTAIHPDLGTVDDFRFLRDRAAELGLELALDLAFQCSPDHPWVAEHPEWFRARPDGTIQYAENPPKKYEDIYPLDFGTASWESLWTELRGVVQHWIDEGVRIFRVDNPHTKSLPFWDWLIADVRSRDPDVIFLSEAFTRPKVMYRLAKGGFDLSYTYFTWRTSASELRAYLQELTTPPVSWFFRPSFWPNTPDILVPPLTGGSKNAFATRAVLAATLSASWGIYGPAFELMESTARPGADEYLDNEKYQLRTWDLTRAESLAPLVQRLNHIRRDHRALRRNRSLHFHPVDNPHLLAYSKTAGPDRILCVVNVDPDRTQEATVDLDLAVLGVRESDDYVVHDLLGGESWRWRGRRNYVRLDPASETRWPAHVFSVEIERRR
ncbi:MAG TPA: alpha-1,4-glucan--maltose-1-phosphate maltosyltransferase [Acidimicrobiia bacterium]|nr:alpha-1,4-glucan--maltose-1-phosphate maltosyltransferase [Acidimicrobiia bacterium]